VFTYREVLFSGDDSQDVLLSGLVHVDGEVEVGLQQCKVQVPFFSFGKNYFHLQILILIWNLNDGESLATWRKIKLFILNVATDQLHHVHWEDPLFKVEIPPQLVPSKIRFIKGIFPVLFEVQRVGQEHLSIRREVRDQILDFSVCESLDPIIDLFSRRLRVKVSIGEIGVHIFAYDFLVILLQIKVLVDPQVVAVNDV